VHMGILFYLLSLFVTNPGLFSAFFMEEISIYAGLLFFGLLYEPISFLLGIGLNLLSRKNELQADRYAIQTTEDREHMVAALKKLSVRNLSNLTPHPLHVFLNYSHPPLLTRIDHIRKETPHVANV
jgi:STE24 endopeptidase